MHNKVFIRVDGSAEIGLGHLIRCFALAQMLKRDFEVTFFCKNIPENIKLELIENDFNVRVLSSEKDFFSFLTGKEIVVLDHYFLDSDYQKGIKKIGNKLVCIDDLHEKEFFADLIINHAPGTVSGDYKSQPYTTLALGLDFVLLRPAFLKAARKNKKESLPIHKLFICFGGSDLQNITKTILEVAILYPEFQKIYPVLGTSFQNHEEIQALAKKDNRIQIKRELQENELVALIEKSDLAIIPASGILLEVLAVGCNVITGSYVHNQKNIFGYFKKTGSINVVENFSKSSMRRTIQQSLEYSQPTNNFIDGRSGERLRKLFWTLFLKIRSSSHEDCEYLFKWANDEDVRRNAFNSVPIPWEQHKEWFFKKISDINTKIFILELENTPVGQVRFEKESDYWKIDYSIKKEFRGKGFGTILLEKSIPEINGTLKACVKIENVGSIKVFEKLGFRKEIKGNVIEFQYQVGS